MQSRLLCAFFFIVIATLSIHGYRPRIKQGKETWGYVSVRKGAHMFFWLYYSTAEVDYKQRPLVIWLQGGPGASSTGIGNFLEIGPQDPDLNNRTNAWTKEVNILFVDNPVGTGYSYVEDDKLLPRNNSAIAVDLVEFMKGFFKKVPEFQGVPIYVFSESYGGKMAAKFALSLNKAIQQKKITCQLAGVALGDSWVSPVDAVLSWGPYLHSVSLVDSIGLKKVNSKAQEVANAVKAGKLGDATKLWSEAEEVVENVTNGVNFYNILNHDKDDTRNNRLSHQREHAFTSPHIVHEGKHWKKSKKDSHRVSKKHKGHQNHIHRRSTSEDRGKRRNDRQKKSKSKGQRKHENDIRDHVRGKESRHRDNRHYIKHVIYREEEKKHRKPHRKPHISLPHHLELLYKRHVEAVSGALDKFMNGPVRDKLKVIPKNVTWGGQSGKVFEALSDDFMTSAVQNVEMLLNTTTMAVVVYNGQLDLIVDTPGVEKWVEGMNWAGTSHWISATRKPIESSAGATEAFSKNFKNFTFYWILKAGHMVPADASDIARKVMKEIVGVKDH
ncbi:retinoid-inducible serine carboxypeptidase-like isoform X1 [Penaeus japonicus]|uniref:retinoid-inducible serine carboxypeptidase-like isoform X1 n=1 Tax=Penaeus japonicus TaxID=27405 RepID=UPI001C710AD3|nr:retinoid-inducible serine carboxypeptidase-like isoform X1 [Penaeus japonicus]